ncbi:MAG: hypothetical protein EOO09_02550 [Chitinophagaceae bacterium]|nr:MAG: hypothetical protein EOO09_02550 [Chitinophagaceae bacterium]
MKKIIMTSLLLGFVSLQLINAQEVNTDSIRNITKDSIASSKKQLQIQKLTDDIAERKVKLAKTESSLKLAAEKNTEAEEKASRVAADNAKLADKLNNDPTDKRLSRKARNSAKDAKRSSKRARKAESSMNSLTRDAEQTRKRIAQDEKKLADLQATAE